MGTRMRQLGMRLARDERTARASCTECPWREDVIGASESRAYDAAKHHGAKSGHRTTVRFERTVEYAPSGHL